MTPHFCFSSYRYVNIMGRPGTAAIAQEHATILRQGWKKQLPPGRAKGMAIPALAQTER